MQLTRSHSQQASKSLDLIQYNYKKLMQSTKVCLHWYKKTCGKFWIVLECAEVLKLNETQYADKLGGAVASWLVCSTPEQGVQIRVLAREIVLCSWARHFTLMVPLSTQVYKWVPANLMLWVTLRWTSTPSRGGGGGVEILLVTSCYRNRDNLRPGGSQLVICRLYTYLYHVDK